MVAQHQHALAFFDLVFVAAAVAEKDAGIKEGQSADQPEGNTVGFPDWILILLFISLFHICSVYVVRSAAVRTALVNILTSLLII